MTFSPSADLRSYHSVHPGMFAVHGMLAEPFCAASGSSNGYFEGASSSAADLLCHTGVWRCVSFGDSKLSGQTVNHCGQLPTALVLD